MMSLMLAVTGIMVSGMVIARNADAATLSLGKPLPAFQMRLNAPPDALAYLGVEAGRAFALTEIPSDLVLIELFSVLCKACHENVPPLNQLYGILSGDPEMAARLKMLGIALNNDTKMAEGYQKAFKVKFPVVPDPGGVIDALFPDVMTPCLILADREGKILFFHEGVIDDVDAVLTEIHRFLPTSAGAAPATAD